MSEQRKGMGEEKKIYIFMDKQKKSCALMSKKNPLNLYIMMCVYKFDNWKYTMDIYLSNIAHNLQK